MRSGKFSFFLLARAWWQTHQFRPHWIPTLACLGFIPLCLHLSAWQMSKYLLKTELQEKLDMRVLQQPIELPPNTDIGRSEQYLRVRLQGAYQREKAFLLENQLYQGRAGYHLMVPFQLSDKRILLVNRGWLPFSGDRSRLPHYTIPQGNLTLEGHLYPPFERNLAEKYRPKIGELVWQSVDQQVLQKAFGQKLITMTLRLDKTDTSDAPIIHWPSPARKVDMHLSYAWQWRIIAGASLSAFLFFGWRKKKISGSHAL